MDNSFEFIVVANTSNATKNLKALQSDLGTLKWNVNDSGKAFIQAKSSTDNFISSLSSAKNKTSEYISKQKKAEEVVNKHSKTTDKAEKNVKKYKDEMGNASKKNNEFGDSAKKASEKTDALSGMFKKLIGFATAYISIGAIKGFAEGALAEYKEANANLVKLESNLKIVKAYGKDPVKIKVASENLQNLSTKIMINGVVDDDAIVAGAAQLSTFQLTDQQISKLLPKITDLTVNMNGLGTTQEHIFNQSNQIGKAITSGALGPLTKAGIVIDANTQKKFKNMTMDQRVAAMQKILEENVGNVNAEMAKTPEGKIQQVANAWGNIKAEIGEKLIPVLGDVANWASQNMPQFKEMTLKVIDGMKKASDWIVKNKDHLINLGIIIGTVITAVKGYQIGVSIYKAWQSATKLMAAAQGALNIVMSLNPVGAVIAGIFILIGVGLLLWKNWDKIKAKTTELWNKFASSPIGKVVVPHLQRAIAAGKLMWQTFTQIFGIIVKLWAKFLSNPLDFIKKGIDALLHPLRTAEQLFSKVSNWWNKLTSGKKTLEIETKETRAGGKADGTHFSGLKRVPFDGYRAILHKNEMVLTAVEAQNYRNYIDIQKETPTKSNTIGIFNGSKNTKIENNINNNLAKSNENNLISMLFTVLEKLTSKLDKFDKLDLLEVLRTFSPNSSEDSLMNIIDMYTNRGV
jgi:hypothetical protein F3_01721|nr:MAG TPA: tail tape measure [Caudoviricetes sp.]DAT71566.1 MAG TPA: tail tape measure [Caudoviricetes sp.]